MATTFNKDETKVIQIIPITHRNCDHGDIEINQSNNGK